MGEGVLYAAFGPPGGQRSKDSTIRWIYPPANYELLEKNCATNFQKTEKLAKKNPRDIIANMKFQTRCKKVDISELVRKYRESRPLVKISKLSYHGKICQDIFDQVWNSNPRNSK